MLSAQPEGEYTVKKVILATLILGIASACTVRTERTVVEKPVPARSAVVVAEPPPPGTVYVPAR